MSITAIVENDTMKLPVHVPNGTRVEITLPVLEPATEPAGKWMLKYAGIADDLPADAASQHDHYLYGTPKR